MFDKLCLVLVFAAVYTTATPLNPSDRLQNIIEESQKHGMISPKLENDDAFLTVPEMIVKYGYPVEIHTVTTADGYILEVHRIPYGKTSGPAPNKPVVWLQHGLLGDSSNWILNIETKALAYKLANEGYDVWMGNARGNTYSKKHVNPDITIPEYWTFSWHEMGVYDVPAVLNYILEQTGAEDLFYAGHSMGTTMFWIAMSEHPELNSKIRLMSAFAPVAFMEHMQSPAALLAPIANVLEDILQFLGAYEFLPTSPIFDFLGRTVCHQNSPVQEVCSNILFLVGGYNSEQLNRTLLPAILGHVPAGASSRNLIHYAQGVNSKDFRKFNHGKVKNVQLYGTEIPPSYDISKITAPVALFWGANDWLAATSDVHRLADLLPNLVLKHRVNHEKYSHLDFLWAIDNNVLLNDPAIAFWKYFH